MLDEIDRLREVETHLREELESASPTQDVSYGGSCTVDGERIPLYGIASTLHGPWRLDEREANDDDGILGGIYQFEYSEDSGHGEYVSVGYLVRDEYFLNTAELQEKVKALEGKTDESLRAENLRLREALRNVSRQLQMLIDALGEELG